MRFSLAPKAIGCWLLLSAGALCQDQPGQEAGSAAPDPSLLKALLPPFTAAPLDAVLKRGNWGPLLLSPSGTYLLADQRSDGRQTLHLLTREGTPLNDLTPPDCRFAAGGWGPTDQEVLIECRSGAEAAPRYRKLWRPTGRTIPLPAGGLARWSAARKDYLLPVPPPPGSPGPARFQRFTQANAPTGGPLAIREPVWNGDGRWLAFLRERGAGMENRPEVREVRVLPARGSVQRVILAWTGWDRLIREQGWTRATGPERVFWTPAGDALYGFLQARTPDGEARYLLRVDLSSPKRQVLPVAGEAEMVSASADCAHWILRLGDHLFRVDFAAAAGGVLP